MAHPNYRHGSGRVHNRDFIDAVFDAQANQEVRIVLAGKLAKVSDYSYSFARSSCTFELGKSALGNAIVGQPMFKAKLSMVSETSACLTGECEFDGRRVIAVDTPGLFDTSADPKHIAREIGKAVVMSSPGPHCFIVTISAHNRFTDEAQKTIDLLGHIFGGNVLDYCIVVFTNEDAITDNDMNIEQWLPEQTRQLPGLARLINSCRGRCMAFNSNSQSASELDRKVQQLLTMIDGMVARNQGRVYTNDMYKEAEVAAHQREKEIRRKAAEKDAKHEREMKELRDKISRLTAKADTSDSKEEKCQRDHREVKKKSEEKVEPVVNLDVIRKLFPFDRGCFNNHLPRTVLSSLLRK